MLLQIDKVLKSEIGEGKTAHLKTDYLSGVNYASYEEDGIFIGFGNKGHRYEFNPSTEKLFFDSKYIREEHYENYQISSIYLLNDDGKTLRRLYLRDKTKQPRFIKDESRKL